MLRTAFAAALIISAATAAQATTYTFSGIKNATLTLTGTGILTGSLATTGGTMPALAFSNKLAGAGTITASSIDLSRGNGYDVVLVIDGNDNMYTEYAEQLTTKKFKKVGSGTFTAQ